MSRCAVNPVSSSVFMFHDLISFVGALVFVAVEDVTLVAVLRLLILVFSEFISAAMTIVGGVENETS